MNAFYEQIYEIVSRIPYGKVINYGAIARMLGRPRAAREVGWAMRNCPENHPWHRVIMADGSVSGGQYAELRKSLLESEGIAFSAEGRVNMKDYRWNGV
ncbi:MAG: methylated-DNA--[protein]-cysteine S-methyltransferase [Clostridiales bacterium]|nr:methylated-DNA--[protein]-cysteine S-methyltransferase [Clostridiales bacterium]